MKYYTLLSFLVLLFLITITLAFPNGSELLPKTFEKRNQCNSALVNADFNTNIFKRNPSVVGTVIFSQDECGSTEVVGIFSKGFDDTSATYGLQIVDECRNVLFDFTEGLNIQPDGSGGTKSFRHKFDNVSIDCDSNGILTKKVHNSKRNCYRNKIRNRLPNKVMITKNGQGIDFAGIF
ncbi:hypothetical protein RhiirA5_402538 [Rhizophagus irregularis]|uniref:Uncharacterized protein n=1 Tax=Rhizophagus irregularis TaxID=588596 RepID=A0A2I1ETW3_9GLOM|nr:hypothetical protein RhiirA5_402538 [Rhizophagus irregularis]PKY25571.1 hypothetical protein RhiirB3_388869 [Rhizophagus irregularis]